jgi:hypothetical protein
VKTIGKPPKPAPLSAGAAQARGEGVAANPQRSPSAQPQVVPGLAARPPEQRAADGGMAPRSTVLGKRPRPESAAKLPPLAPKATARKRQPQEGSSSSARTAQKQKAVRKPEQVFRQRLANVWSKLQIDHGQLLTAYRARFGTSKVGPDLLQALLNATKELKPQARTPDDLPIKHFVVKLDSLSPVNVLVWGEDDGSIGDIQIVKGDSPRQIEDAEKVLLSRIKSRVAMASVGDPSRLRLGPLWQRRSKEFDGVLTAWLKQPGNKVRPEFRILEELLAMTNRPDARSIPVFDGEGLPHPDIQRFTLELPGLDRPLDVLRRLNDDGTLGDMRIVPENKARLPWLVSQMEHGRVAADAHKETVAGEGERVGDSMWRPLKQLLASQFEAFREDRRQKHERVPAGGAFMRHLDQLCIADREAVPVDPGNSIQRHVIKPDGSSKPITVLRRTDARGMAAMRVIDDDLSNEDHMLKDLVKRIRKPHGQAASAASAASSSGAGRRPAGRVQASQPKMTNAAQLKTVLELALANKRAGSEDLLAGVVKKTGIPNGELRNWLGPDGNLLRKQNGLLKLQDIFDFREDLEILFTGLGQPESAANLPEDLTTARVVEMLQARLSHPDASLAQLIRIVDPQAQVLKRHFEIDHPTFMLTGNRKLQRLPDYADHLPALKVALEALGHVDRANSLPAAETGAERFMRELKAKIYYVKLAVGEMRRNPELSPAEAARRVNAWPEMPNLVSQVVNADGTVRAAADIASNLAAFQDDQRPELRRLLSHLTVQASANDMTDQLLPAKGLEPGKVFIVRDPSGAGIPSLDAGSAKRARRLEVIYANSPDLVVAPRSYRAERPKQALRWLSTLIKKEFKDAVEVQAYWDARRGKVWVSSNNSSVNRKIEAFLKEGKLVATLQAQEEDPHATREGRHASKLRKMLSDESARPPEAKALLEAMCDSKNFKVPTDPSNRRPGVQTHAERRIKRAFEEEYGEDLNRKLVAGTRRPCAICAKDLALPDTAHRGPFWMSRAGAEGYAIGPAVKEDLDASIGSFVTLTRKGALTLNYDTDSTDDESTQPRDSQRAKASASTQRAAPMERGKRSASDMSFGPAADGEPKRTAPRSKRRYE